MAHPIVYGPAGSTYVWSARLALAEKGVTHELVEVRFGGHREEPHLSRHPFAGLVPDWRRRFDTVMVLGSGTVPRIRSWS
jgi:hypothetical protein